MSSFLLLQQCPVRLARLMLTVFEIEGKWPYSCYFVGCCFQDLFNIAHSILRSSHLAFSLCVLLATMWCIHTVVRIQLELGRNPVLFYRIDHTSI